MALQGHQLLDWGKVYMENVAVECHLPYIGLGVGDTGLGHPRMDGGQLVLRDHHMKMDVPLAVRHYRSSSRPFRRSFGSLTLSSGCLSSSGGSGGRAYCSALRQSCSGSVPWRARRFSGNCLFRAWQSSYLSSLALWFRFCPGVLCQDLAQVKMRNLSFVCACSCIFFKAILRSICFAILMKKPSTRFRQDACLGVKTNSNLSSRVAIYFCTFADECTFKLFNTRRILSSFGYFVYMSNEKRRQCCYMEVRLDR